MFISIFQMVLSTLRNVSKNMTVSFCKCKNSNTEYQIYYVQKVSMYRAFQKYCVNIITQYINSSTEVFLLFILKFYIMSLMKKHYFLQTFCTLYFSSCVFFINKQNNSFISNKLCIIYFFFNKFHFIFFFFHFILLNFDH